MSFGRQLDRCARNFSQGSSARFIQDAKKEPRSLSDSGPARRSCASLAVNAAAATLGLPLSAGGGAGHSGSQIESGPSCHEPRELSGSPHISSRGGF